MEGRDVASKKFLQATRRETFIILGLYLLFFVWWYVTAYGFGDDPSRYRYILGFPEWFFYSCIAGYAGISFLLWAVIKIFFKELPLSDEKEEVGKDG
ncbi:YhdT family protein [uncultured Cloacibacillus sp.]|uniref:YhdT family protein n=1 Tax=uncultured Cloacibacillus sp. TaxID=889794 RepID=UPI0025870429|nr:YhdT family protein [uncultured Cloacibacillus sp.]